ncbi:AAA family ATPase [Kitasatospora sp. A2-31]|uniref:AAA family ATPase n=1 Tax=Kitasatospora sp. A2-31 TaxID=2916414 RepID=UPI001EEC7B35|nr:ATP-binding protein [Kitasatospora sp. A2-31]
MQYTGGGQVPPRPVAPPAPPYPGGATAAPPPAPAAPSAAGVPQTGPVVLQAPQSGQPQGVQAQTAQPQAAQPQVVQARSGQPPYGGHPAGPRPAPVPAPASATGPSHAAAAPAPAPVPAGGTGHFLLPSGAPVQLPAHPPQPHAPTGPLAVLLIGPAGAGKTTVARYWAERRQTPTAHISLDDVREWVQSGFANPQSGWNSASEAQYRLARRTCGFACRNYLANGISCIIDDAVFPDRPAIGLGGWKRHIGPGMIPVVLLPSLDSVLSRNARRSGTRRLGDEEVARIHGRMAGWYNSGLPIIDNSHLDVAATAAELDRAILARLMGIPVR